MTHISRVSCQRGPTRHANAWQIGPFWQDILNMWEMSPNGSYGDTHIYVYDINSTNSRMLCIILWSIWTVLECMNICFVLMIFGLILILNELCSYIYIFQDVQLMGFVVYNKISNWWGIWWPMVACPLRTLVVLYRMFTFIMCLIWLMSEILCLYSSTSLGCFCQLKFVLNNGLDNIQRACFICQINILSLA